MNTKLKDELAQQVGMTKVEYNADGEPQYIGTKKQWEKFDELLDNEVKNAEEKIKEEGQLGDSLVGDNY